MTTDACVWAGTGPVARGWADRRRRHCVYVLRLANGGYYVGSTRNLRNRLWEHFVRGGARATKESPAVAVVQVLRFEDRLIGCQAWRLIVEAFVASEYAAFHGEDRVRGGWHGEGWSDRPRPNCLRLVRRARWFMGTELGAEFWTRVEEMDLGEVRGWIGQMERRSA